MIDVTDVAYLVITSSPAKRYVTYVTIFYFWQVMAKDQKKLQAGHPEPLKKKMIRRQSSLLALEQARPA